MKSRTLIFDLDGTISDPFEGISKSINYALESLDYPAVDPERIRPLIGPPLDTIFETLIGRVESAVKRQLVNKYRERYATTGYTENILYDDIPELIATLADMDYQLGVCTSKRSDYAGSIVDMFGLSTYFKFIDGGGDGIEKSMQLERLIHNGLDAGSTTMIGDRHFDIVAARNNSLRSIGVTWGFAAVGELEAAEPNYIVRSPDELLRLLV